MMLMEVDSERQDTQSFNVIPFKAEQCPNSCQIKDIVVYVTKLRHLWLVMMRSVLKELLRFYL